MSLKRFDNFLSEEEIKIVGKECDYIWNEIGPSNLTSQESQGWDASIVDYSKEVFISEFWNGETGINQAMSQDNNLKTPGILLNRLHQITPASPTAMLFYYWTPGSYIPWHNDGHCSHAGTLYLNTHWEFWMGGNYQHENENEEGEVVTIIPKYNTFLLQGDSMNHATTITKPGFLRKTIQLFYDTEINLNEL